MRRRTPGLVLALGLVSLAALALFGIGQGAASIGGGKVLAIFGSALGLHTTTPFRAWASVV